MKENIMSDSDQLLRLLKKVKKLAKEYRELTNKTLGVTGEVAEYEAARIFDLTLEPQGRAGFDATDSNGRKFQIKGRRIGGTCLGEIGANQDFDAVLLVLLDEDFEVAEIYEACREDVLGLLLNIAPNVENNRCGIPIRRFIALAHLRWPD